jgi:DNA anti-recombination protein RmuC
MTDMETKSLALNQQSARLAAKVAPLVMASALLQEAMNLNQQLIQQVNALTDALKNEREAKSPESDGRKVPGETRSPA